MFLNCPETKYYIFNCIYWSPLGLDTYRLRQKKSLIECFFLNRSGVHFECICKRVFWQNVMCLIQNIITSEPQLQFQWKKLQNVALVAGFNLHSFSSLNFQKREFYGHFSGAHLLKKMAIFESNMKRTSAVHTYLNCTYSHGGYKLWL